MGIRRIDDPNYPNGHRSNAEMRKLLDEKIMAQNGECALCNEKFSNYSDIVPDHISPRGMGGAWRDDHPDNIQAVHWWCNGEKRSSRGLSLHEFVRHFRRTVRDVETRFPARVSR